MLNRIFFVLSLFFIFSCSTKPVKYEFETIRIATFNIEWLGDGIDDKKMREESDYLRIAEVIEKLDADLIGLQEIENEKALLKLMVHLPDFSYVMGNTGWVQNPAIIFRKNIDVRFVNNYQPLAVKENKTRAGLWVKVRKENFDFHMMVVHFKSTSSFDNTPELKAESFQLRQLQSKALRKWADSLVTSGTEQDIIIIGDFNDNPNRTNMRNLEQLVYDGEFSFLTQDMGSCKNPRWDLIDHVAVNKSVKNRYVEGSEFVYDIFQSHWEHQSEMISDHCPVLVSFEIETPDND